MTENFLHEEPKRQKVAEACPAGMQHDACSTGVAGEGGQTAMDTRQHSTIRASGQPQWSDIEPQTMPQEMAHMSLEEVQHVVAALHRRQGELERQNEALHQIQ